MSKEDYWYNDYSQNAQLAELIGTVTALKNQQTYTNGLLEELVAKLSEIQTTLIFAVAGTATRRSQTIPKKPTAVDLLNDPGNN